jgi:hypothetical protein
LQLPGDASRMTTHTIIPKVDQTGFDVAIVGNNGVRQTLLGFETQADAEAWIAWDKRPSAAEDPLTSSYLRTSDF